MASCSTWGFIPRKRRKLSRKALLSSLSLWKSFGGLPPNFPVRAGGTAGTPSPFPPTTIISTMDAHPFISYFTTLLESLQQGINEDRGDDWVVRITAIYLSRPKAVLDGATLFSLLGFTDRFSTDPPPTAPSLPQEELQLLRTSFDLAFTSLAGQVKELAAKVNGSGPPPKAAAAPKPPARTTPKPRAPPPAAPAPTPASHHAPPPFSPVVKAPSRPSLVVALRPSAPGAVVPLAICRSPP